MANPNCRTPTEVVVKLDHVVNNFLEGIGFGRGRNDSIWLSVIATAEELMLRSVWM